MRRFFRKLLICLLTTAAALAQENAPKAAVVPTPDNPLSAWNKFAYGRVKDRLLRSAEKVPEENYNFRPTEAVRTFGQIVGHVADAQYLYCSIEMGEKNPAPKIEQSKTSKADLIAALKDAFAYCDKAYGGMTDASATQMVKLFEDDTPKLDVLTVNIIHSMEHYGNLVTYMRLKNIVPPTSESAVRPMPKE
jgi:uncharacterized damage-inducible protein DinB